MRFLDWFISPLFDLPVGAQALLVAWILTMIALPVVNWIWGENARKKNVALSVSLQAATVLAILNLGWGARRALITAGIVVGLGWGVEYIGSHTGVPFGRYHYTPELQPQLGQVPLVIPFAWLMMLPTAWAVARVIVGEASGWTFVLVSALAFTAWDLFLDPQMVKWGFWTWDNDPETSPQRHYFGIPWVNFVGWFVASMFITYVIVAYPTTFSLLPIGPLFFIYALTWLLETFCQLFFCALPGPALVGFVGMGVFVCTAMLAR